MLENNNTVTILDACEDYWIAAAPAAIYLVSMTDLYPTTLDTEQHTKQRRACAPVCREK